MLVRLRVYDLTARGYRMVVAEIEDAAAEQMIAAGEAEKINGAVVEPSLDRAMPPPPHGRTAA